MSLKSIIHQHCLELLQQRIHGTDSELKRLDASQMSETKSSMGDKYETSREMMQREREHLQQNLSSNQQLLRVLQHIDVSIKKDVVEIGALLETATGYYYMAVGLGKVVVEGRDVFVISPQSPVGKLLIGKKSDQVVALNGNTITILSIA